VKTGFPGQKEVQTGCTGQKGWKRDLRVKEGAKDEPEPNPGCHF